MGGKGRFISSEVYWGAGELSPWAGEGKEPWEREGCGVQCVYVEGRVSSKRPRDNASHALTITNSLSVP